MVKVKVSNIELEIENAQEVMHMGGPYVGDAWFGGKMIIEQCIADNFIYNEKTNLLFFVKFHKINYYEYFTINFYHLASGNTCQFTTKFDMVYIKQFINDHEIEIFNSFHDKFEYKRMVFNLDDEEFAVVDTSTS